MQKSIILIDEVIYLVDAFVDNNGREVDLRQFAALLILPEFTSNELSHERSLPDAPCPQDGDGHALHFRVQPQAALGATGTGGGRG